MDTAFINSEKIASHTNDYAGIYLIRHKSSGMVYVGQSNNIHKRWMIHKRLLGNGSHHNENLKKLSVNNNVADFEFEVVLKAPINLSSLQLQRWLIKEERKLYVSYTSKGLALNIADPEIVGTNEAIKEYKKEQEDKRNHNDKMISLQRKKIKLEINVINEELYPLQHKLYELRINFGDKSELKKKSTGWRRIFYGRPIGFDLKKERLLLNELSCKINDVAPSVKTLGNQVFMLEKEYKDLYGQFSKVAASKINSSYLRILGRSPSKIIISE